MRSIAPSRRFRLDARSWLVLTFLACVLALGAGVAVARELQAAALAQGSPSIQSEQAQSADPLSPFEYAINSVIGRQLNVPGAD